MARKTFFFLALVLGVLLAVSPALPCHKTAFGPKAHGVGWWRIHSSLQTFKVEKPGQGLIEISKANAKRIRTGFVILNGQFISLRPILSGKASVMQAAVHLRHRNYLFVFLYGERGAGLKIKVMAKEKETEQPPVAESRSVETDEDTAVPIMLTGSSSTGGTLAFEILSQPANGTLSGTPPDLTYTPADDYNGPDSFTFKVNDGKADSEPATVNITVNPVNDPPVAVAAAPSSAYVGETVGLDGSGSTDVDGDTLTYQWSLVSYPGDIEPSIDIDQDDPAKASFVPLVPGEYVVQLVVRDGTTDSDPATVNVSVSYPPFLVSQQKLTASDGTAGDLFGSSVSVDGSRAIIGAGAKGAAYIFDRESPWTEKHRVDGEAADHFGAAVAISGDYAIVGAPGADKEWIRIFSGHEYQAAPEDGTLRWNAGAGRWEIFPPKAFTLLTAGEWARGFRPKEIKMTHNGSSIELRVYGSDGTILGETVNHNSGGALSLMAVSDIARIHINGATRITDIQFLAPTGVAHVLKHDGIAWIKQETKLFANDRLPGDLFGSSLALSGEVAVVGAPWANAAYVFNGGSMGWGQQARLAPNDGEQGDGFGISVAVGGGVIIVGADMAAGNGSAYVFTRNGSNWVQEARLFDEEGSTGDHFGASVSISNDYLVVGAPNADDSGALFVFKFDGSNWNLKGKEAALDSAPGQDFGRSVAISGDAIFAGAMGDDEKGDEAGATYVHTIVTY